MPSNKNRHGLRISSTLTLPDETTTETLAILAARGKGKTFTASVLAEEMITAGLPVLIIDPLGVWWGLRSSADGQSDGLPVVIFGGDHADVPLTEGSAELVADAIVENRFPAILDLSHFSKSAMRRFATPFLERLYHRNRDPLHVIVDEADLLAPQRVQADGARLLGAMDDIQRRGRARGLGTTLITQRPAVLNKDVLTQASVLLVLGMTGPRDVAAIDEWVRLHAKDEEASAVKSSLASLPVGTAWVWSPSFLGLLEKVKIRHRTTFDSSATPKVGTKRVVPQRITPVDLDRLGAQIAQAAQHAAETDPKALRARVKDLERKLARAQSGLDGNPRPAVEPEIIEVEVPVPILDDHDRAALQRLLDDSHDAIAQIEKTLDAQRTALVDLSAKVDAATSPDRLNAAPAQHRHAHRPAQRSQSRSERARPTTRPAPSDTPRLEPRIPVADAPPREGLSKAERKILSALAQHGERTTQQVALLTGYSHKSGGFRNALSRLRTSGYIDGRGSVRATDAGLDALGPYDPLPTGRALVDWWKDHHLGKAERAIIDVLLDAYPHPVSIEEIAEATDYSASSGGFRNALSRLRSLELASGRGELVLSDTLAED